MAKKQAAKAERAECDKFKKGSPAYKRCQAAERKGGKAEEKAEMGKPRGDGQATRRLLMAIKSPATRHETATISPADLRNVLECIDTAAGQLYLLELFLGDAGRDDARGEVRMAQATLRKIRDNLVANSQ